MYKPSGFATFLSIWTLCLLSSLTAAEAFCSMSVTVNGVGKSGDTIVVPKETPVVVDCHLGGTLYRGDKPHLSSSFTLTEATQGSYHCRCSGGRRRSRERILVVEPGFDESMTLTGFKGDNMTIPCGLNGTLQGVAYETIWERNYSRLPSERSTDREDERDLVIENVTEEDTAYDYRCVVVRIGNNRLNGAFIHGKPRRIALIDSPADISHKVTQGEILCSTQDSTTYPGDRYCLYVEDSGGEKHEVECDDRPVSGDVEELKKLGNTAVCIVSRTTTGSVPNRTVSNETTHIMTNDPTVPSTPSALKTEVVVPSVIVGGMVAAGLVIVVVVVFIMCCRRRNRPIVVKVDPETGNNKQEQEVRREEPVNRPGLSHDDIDSPQTRPPIPGCSSAESSSASTTSQRPQPVRHSHSQRNMCRHGNRSPQYPPPKHNERPCHLWLSPPPAKTDLYPSLAKSPVERVHNYITPTRSKPHMFPIKSTPLGMCYTERTLPSPVKNCVSSPSPVTMAALPLPGNINHRISSPAQRFNVSTPLEKSIRAESRLEDTHSGTSLSISGGVERGAVMMTRPQTGNDSAFTSPSSSVHTSPTLSPAGLQNSQ